MRFGESVPFAARGVVHTVMGISNGILVAAFAGGEGIAIWTVASSWRAVLMAVTESVIDAGTAPLASARGRGDPEAVSRLTGQVVLVGLVISLTMLVAGVAVIAAMGGIGGLVAASVANELSSAEFFAVMLIGDAIGTAADGVRAALLGRGFGGRSAAGGAASKALQLLLGWVFIPQLGLLGVLAAHCVSQSVETAIQVSQGWEYRGDVRLRAVVWVDLVAQVRFGIVSAGTEATRNVLYATCVASIDAACGVSGLVLHTALVKVSNLHYKALGGIAGGARSEIAAMIGSGAGLGGMRLTGRTMLLWGAVFSVVYGIIPAASWELLAPGVGMADVGAAVLVLVVGMPAEVASMLGGAYLRATQNERALAVTELLGSATMLGASTLLLHLGWGVPGVWAAFACDACVCAGVAWLVARAAGRV